MREKENERERATSRQLENKRHTENAKQKL